MIANLIKEHGFSWSDFDDMSEEDLHDIVNSKAELKKKNVLLKRKNQIPLVLLKIFLNKTDYYNILYKGDEALRCVLSPFIFLSYFYIHKILILTYTYCTH